MEGLDEPVQLVPYDPQWPVLYEQLSQDLQEILGTRIAAIEHIGSTAVPGLIAKPVIDILISTLVPDDAATILVAHSYEDFGEAGVPGRRYLRRRRGAPVNVHLVQPLSVLWRDNIALRDYLRSQPDAAQRYADAKMLAVRQGADTLLAYSAAKAGAVQRLLLEARG